jgi:hypothetical protein
MKRICITFALFLSFLGGFAQNTATRKEPKPYNPPLPSQPPIKMVLPRVKNVNLPLATATGFTGISPSASPEIVQANSLQDVPVNKFTGTPIVKYPLYTLQEAGLGVSLAMNYNASGIRGNQLSGYTGLGWDLEGIPMLTRIVRGLPDEGKLEMTSFSTFTAKGGYYGNGYIGSAPADYDKEPDFFFLNVGGATYKFVFTPNGSVRFFPDADIKVSVGTAPYEGSSIAKKFTAFSFTMPDGTVYEFTNENVENTAEVEVAFAQNNKVYPFPFNVNSPNFAHYLKTNSVISAWYCKKITSPYGHQINFSYSKVLYSYYKIADNEASTYCPSSVDKKVNRVFVQGATIDKIESRHTVVKFNDGYTFCITIPDPITFQPQEYCSLIGIPNREDIDDWTQAPSNSSSAKILKNMVVYDKDHPTEKITWSFDYGYFTGADNSGYDLPSGYTYNGTNPVGLTHKKRLKLSKINFPDGNHHDFTYYGEENGFNFKTRFTYGIDHWGYINGSDGNINGRGLIGTDFISSCGSNRETDIAFLTYGSLSKISSSVGSETHLEYEANRAKNYNSGNTDIGGLRIKKIRVKDLVRATEIIKEYSYLSGGLSEGFLCIKPIYRFNNYNAQQYSNSALYEILLAEAGRPSVGYGKVTETVYDVANTLQIGKTISYFDQDETELSTATPTQYCYFDEDTQTEICVPTVAYYLDGFIPDYDFRGGNLLKEENYNQSNVLLSSNEMAYTPNNGIKSDSLYCQRVVKLNGVNQTKFYYLKIKKYRAEQTISKAFSQDGTGTPLITPVDFTYKDEMPQLYRDTYKGKHNQLVKTTATDSYGFEIDNFSKYTADFSFDIDSILQCEPDCIPCVESCQYWLVTEHVPASGTKARAIYDMQSYMSALPVETYSKRNGKVINSAYQTYSLRLPILSFSLRTVPKSTFSEVIFDKTTDLMNKDVGYGTARSEILSFNAIGLPTLVQTKRGASFQINYDAENVLPVSKIQNYGVSDALTSSYQYLQRYQGISKEISPNDLEIRYNYRPLDARLDKILDKDDKILKKFNYQTTPTN